MNDLLFEYIPGLAIPLISEMFFFVIPILAILLLRKTRLENKIQLALCLIIKSFFAPWLGLSFLGWYQSLPNSNMVGSYMPGFDFLFTVPPFIVFTLMVVSSFKGSLAAKFKTEHFLIISSILLSDLPAVLLLSNINLTMFGGIGAILIFWLVLPGVTIFVFAIAFLVALFIKKVRARY